MMADRTSSGVSSPAHQNGGPKGPASRSPAPRSPVPTSPALPHSNSSSGAGPVLQIPPSPLRAFRALRTMGAVVNPGSGPGPEGSPRPRGQSLGSALSSRTRSIRSRRGGPQPEEPEALLDLILQSQAQRLEDQRASISLLPDPGPGPSSSCESCSPGLDFYYTLIHYQSHRMEDQRCPLPADPDQDHLFSLVQRLQSRRMDEQRAQLTHTHTHTHTDTHADTHIDTHTDTQTDTHTGPSPTRHYLPQCPEH